MLKEGAGAVKEKLAHNVSISSTLAHMDTAISLPHQLLMVLLVAVFILYPALVSASLSMFACRILDTGSGPHPEMQQATWVHGYWLRDMNQACYAGIHASLYLPLGIVPEYYFWESVSQVQMLILVSIDVFGRALPEYQQALLLICGLSVIGMVNMACSPVIARLLTVMEFLSLGVLSLTITMGLFFVKTSQETVGISQVRG
ncbi:hypothetical protein HYH02_011678 [Chlamydomonas schloesseri]|uniref:Uncharacterized protein n=1 Tax=Chlamydomonas schloesseri TaxID=2026947 RepID=A0A835TE18_9CHLO|nr:hypothetical protein HYH02_011678 [Chlamydomonas schloesseri]|eukprot:KAG2436175.1 hypothetical protein HYH02_011678 [Chlamydomonas schloesseri]